MSFYGPTEEETQERLVRARALWDKLGEVGGYWFGESNIADPRGNPKPMYHGTDTLFAAFDKKFCRHGRKTFSFHENATLARQYGKNVMTVFLRAEKIFDYENADHQRELQRLLKDDPSFEDWWVKEAEAGDWEMLEKGVVQRYLKDNGYDAFYVNDHPGKALQVFEPSQIKILSIRTNA